MNHSEQERSVLEQELELLLQKKERRELTRADISRILGLNFQLYVMIDEFDNYEKFLRPGCEFSIYLYQMRANNVKVSILACLRQRLSPMSWE